MDKKFPELTDFYEEGRHKIKVFPKQEWDAERKEFKPGTHKSGTSKAGNKWWMYSHTVEEGEKKTYISLFANAKNKPDFDSGEVIAVIKQKRDKKGKEVYTMENGSPKPVLSVFFDPVEPGITEEDPTEDLPF